jgi:hypothetical protein
MGETTTIQITTEQRDALVARKTYDDEPIKAVVGRLLEDDDAGEGRVLSEDAVDEIIEELAERVDPEQGYIDDDKIARAVAAKIDYAELGKAVADEVEGRMR